MLETQVQACTKKGRTSQEVRGLKLCYGMDEAVAALGSHLARGAWIEIPDTGDVRPGL